MDQSTSLFESPAKQELQMLRARTGTSLIAASLILAACGSESVTTAPDAESAPTFRTEKSPAGPGALVYHGSGGFFSTVNEPGAPYFVAIGISSRAAAEFCRGGESEIAPYKELFVENPNGNIHGVLKSDGKVPLLLFPAGTEDICSGTPVAEGTGLYTDRSSNVFGGSGRGTSGFRVRGQVTTVAGERQHVIVVVQSQLGPTGFTDVVVKIKVQ